MLIGIIEDEACLMALKSVGDKLRSADAMPSSHPLYPEVTKVCEDRIGILRDGFPSSGGDVGSVKDGWTVLAKQGHMTIYNREVESSSGTCLDPLQVSSLSPNHSRLLNGIFQLDHLKLYYRLCILCTM